MFVTNQCVPFYLSSKYIVEKKKKKTAQSRYMYSEIKKKIKTLMGYLQISNSFKARLSLFYFLSIYLLIFFSFIHFPFIIIIINFFLDNQVILVQENNRYLKSILNFAL